MPTEIPIDERFARAVYDSFVLAYAEERGRAYSSTPIAEIADPRFRAAAALFQDLSDPQKVALTGLIQQTAADVLALLFQLIQGGTYLEGFNDADFHLAYGPHEIGRELADHLLNLDQDGA